MVGSEFSGEISEGSRKKADQEHSTLGLKAVKEEEIVEKEMMENAGKKRKDGTGRNPNRGTEAQNEDKSVVLL
jgi:hypothetical protein